MRNVMTRIFLGFFFITLVNQVIGQKGSGGQKAIGARLGGASGVTYKSYNKKNTAAFEFIGAWNFDSDNDGFSLTALWEKHVPFSGEKLAAVIGGGPTWITNNGYFGASVIVGLDWRLGQSPLNISFDWMPTYFFINTSRFSAVNAAVSVRYILNNRKLKGNK